MKATEKWKGRNNSDAWRSAILALLCGFVALSAHPIEPLWSNDATVQGYFADLLKSGGFGFAHWEAAAFLVLSPDGRYGCIAWPFSNGHHQQKFRGRVPDFTVAIVHTHPRNTALPSPGDRATAKRLGIPVIILTSRNIYVVATDGSIIEVVKDNAWVDAARDSETLCETPRERTLRVSDGAFVRGRQRSSRWIRSE